MSVPSLPGMCYVLLGVMTASNVSHSEWCCQPVPSYISEYKDDEQSLTYPSERLVETVISSETLLDGMMADVAHTFS